MRHHWLISLPLIIWLAPLHTQWQDTQKMNTKSLKIEQSKGGKKEPSANFDTTFKFRGCKISVSNTICKTEHWISIKCLETMGKIIPTVANFLFELKLDWDYMLTSGS